MFVISECAGNSAAKACMPTIKRAKELRLSQLQKLGHKKSARPGLTGLTGLQSRVERTSVLDLQRLQTLKTLDAKAITFG